MTDKKKSKKSKSGKDKKKPKRRTFKGRKLLPNEFTGVQPYAGVARGMNYGGPYRGWVGGAGGGIIGERAPATKVVQDPKLVEQVADLKASLFIAQARAKFASEHAATRTAQNLDNMQHNMAKNRKEDDAARKERIEGMGGDVSDDAIDDLGIDFYNKSDIDEARRGPRMGRDMDTEASKSEVTELERPKPPEPQRGTMDVDEDRLVVLPEPQRGTMHVENRLVVHPQPSGRPIGSKGSTVDRAKDFKNTNVKGPDRHGTQADERKARLDELKAIKRGVKKNNPTDPAVAQNLLTEQTGLRRRPTPRLLDDVDNMGSSVAPVHQDMSDRQKRRAEDYARTNPEAKVPRQESMDLGQGRIAQVFNYFMGTSDNDDY